MIVEGNVSQPSRTCCSIKEAVFTLIGKIVFIATHFFAFTSAFTFITVTFWVWKEKGLEICVKTARPLQFLFTWNFYCILRLNDHWHHSPIDRYIFKAACKLTNLRGRDFFYFLMKGFVRGPSCRMRTTGSRCQWLFLVASLLNGLQIVKNYQELSCFQIRARSCNETVGFRATKFSAATLKGLCK